MANTTLSQIRVALGDLLKTVKTSNGYVTQLEDAQIYHAYCTEFAACKVYPKATLWFDQFSIVQRPSDTHDKTAVLSILFVDRFQSGDGATDYPYEAVEAFVDDLERVLSLNHSLGGLVENVTIMDAELDSGFAAPEGMAIIAVKVEYKSRFH